MNIVTNRVPRFLLILILSIEVIPASHLEAFADKKVCLALFLVLSSVHQFVRFNSECKRSLEFSSKVFLNRFYPEPKTKNVF